MLDSLTIILFAVQAILIAIFVWLSGRSKPKGESREKAVEVIREKATNIETQQTEAAETKGTTYEEIDAEVERKMREPLDTGAIIGFAVDVLSDIRSRRTKPD